MDEIEYLYREVFYGKFAYNKDALREELESIQKEKQLYESYS